MYVSEVVGVTLQALDEAVNGLELGLDGDELVACQRAADRLSAKLGVAYGEFDSLELWDLDAATSMTAWLRDHATMAGGEASRVLRSARRLRGLPVTAAAALDGSLSAGAVRAIVANVWDKTAELFAEHEAELIPTLVPLCAGDVAAAMRTWAALAEDALGLGEPAEPLSKV
ncbi:MAG: DUF222 domain-containing protein, partial [Acidimicrobiia bacterium]|nr:DUF222 domain-containing protein [Acidimicrobiia bacterium]